MRPPKLPIENKENYFNKLIEEVKNYFPFELNFSGFNETVEEYENLDSTDYKKSWELSRDLNVWGEYFSELKSVTEKLYLDAETDKKKIFAEASINKDVTKVANGDRLANKDDSVIKIRKKRNALKAFSLALESKIDFCYRIHHHCKATCNWIKIYNDRSTKTNENEPF